MPINKTLNRNYNTYTLSVKPKHGIDKIPSEILLTHFLVFISKEIHLQSCITHRDKHHTVVKTSLLRWLREFLLLYACVYAECFFLKLPVIG